MADPFRTYVQEIRDYCTESQSLRPEVEAFSSSCLLVQALKPTIQSTVLSRDLHKNSYLLQISFLALESGQAFDTTE